MFRRLFVFLLLTVFILGPVPVDLHGDDPGLTNEPAGNFGDPNDDFNPRAFRLTADLATSATNPRGMRGHIKAKPDPTLRSLLDHLIRLLEVHDVP